MTAEHNHFVCLVAAANLTNRIVGSGSFRIDAVHDIELKHDFGTIVENAEDTSEVFIAHDDCGYHFVNVKRAVVESTDLPKLPTGIINPYRCAIVFQKRVELFIDLTIRQRSRCVRRGRRSWRWCGERERTRIWSITLLCLFVSGS